MDLAHLAARHGEHAVRVVVAQVLLADERSAPEVVERFDGIRVEARFVVRLLVVRNVLVAAYHGLLDSLELDPFDPLMRHRQDIPLVRIHRVAFLRFCFGTSRTSMA